MSYFGITANDIVRAFHGTEITDFATDGETGQQIITRELELAFNESLDLLDVNVLNQLQNGFNGYIVQACEDASGNFIIPLLGIPEECSLDVREWEDRNLDWFHDSISQTTQPGLLGCNKCKVDLKSYPQFTDWILDGSNLILGSSYEANQKLIISYRLESGETPSIPSLGRFIRNKVACILGHNLYTASENTWSLVEQYCKEASKFEEKYSGIHKYIPSELKRLKWLEYPYSTGWGTIVSRRVS